MPVGHGGEVRIGRILVTAAMNNGHLAVFIEALESSHARIESKVVVDDAQFVLGNAYIRPLLIIGIVAVGHNSIQAIVAAGELEYDEYLATGGRLGSGGLCCLRKGGWHHAQRAEASHAS